MTVEERYLWSDLIIRVLYVLTVQSTAQCALTGYANILHCLINFTQMQNSAGNRTAVGYMSCNRSYVMQMFPLCPECTNPQVHQAKTTAFFLPPFPLHATSQEPKYI